MRGSPASTYIATVDVGPISAHAGLVVARFQGIHHSTESFIVWIYLGALSPDVMGESFKPLEVNAPMAGTVSVYGHGGAYGSQHQLDDALETFDAEANLTPALQRFGQPVRQLSWVVIDDKRRVREVDVFRFARLSIEVRN